MPSGSHGKGKRVATGCLMGIMVAGAISGCAGLHLADKGMPDIPEFAREAMASKAAGSLSPGKDGVWSLGVDEAVALALSRSFAVFAAFEAENEARGTALSSWSSVLPRASGSLSYVRADSAPEFSLQTPAGVESFRLGALDNYLAQAGLDWVVFQGGRGLASLRLAELGREDAVCARSELEMKVAFLVRMACIDWLLAKEAVALRKEQSAAAKARVARAKARFAQGLATALDVSGAEVRLKSAGAAAIAAMNRMNSAKTVLLSLLGLDQDARVEIIGSLESFIWNRTPCVETELFLKRLPSLRRAEIAVRAGETKLKSSRGELLPKASAFARAGFEKPSQKSFGGIEGKEFWNLGFAIDLPVFDGLGAGGRIARDSAAVRRAKWEKAEAERSAALRIEKAVEEVASAAEILAARDEAASAAKANLDLAKAAEKAGTVAMLDVQEAQAELAEANLQRFIALHACVAARFVFELETGAPILTE